MRKDSDVEAGQSSLEYEIQGREKRFVHDQLHQVSRRVVDWAEEFKNPIIVFEDPKDMRDDREYGTMINRRLHSLPFAQLQGSCLIVISASLYRRDYPCR